MAHTVPGNKHAVQNILNWSFDPDYNVLTFETLESDGTSLFASPTRLRALKLDDSSTANVTYIGYAPIGTAGATAGWQIQKLDKTSGLIITWADGNSNYDNVWNNRTSLTYV